MNNEAIGNLIEFLILVLDARAGDVDLEPDADYEPDADNEVDGPTAALA